MMFTKQLDPQKSMGIDGIGPNVLNHSAMALFRPLHHLFLLSLSQNYIPEEWRVHLITPILESGDASSIANYRPIFLSPRYLKDMSILKLSILSLIVYVQFSLDFCRSIPPCISYFCSWTIFWCPSKAMVKLMLSIWTSEKHSTVWHIMSSWLNCGWLA